jgi:hypothetical protein
MEDLRTCGEELDLRGVDDTREFVIREVVERRIPTEKRVDGDHVAEYGTGSGLEPVRGSLRRPTTDDPLQLANILGVRPCLGAVLARHRVVAQDPPSDVTKSNRH